MAPSITNEVGELRRDAYRFLNDSGEVTAARRAALVLDGVDLLRRCVSAADPEAQAIVLTGQSVMARDDGTMEASLSLLDEAEQLATVAGPDIVARTLLHRVTAYVYTGEFAAALQAGNRSREHLDPELLPRLLSNIALVHKRQENFQMALDAFAEALEAATSVDDAEAIAVIRSNRGLLAMETGDLKAAELEFRTALLQPGGLSQFRRAVSEHNLGVALCKQGLLRSALVHMDRAQPFLESKGSATLEASNDRCEALFYARLLSRAFDLIEGTLGKLVESDPLRAETLMLAARIATASEDGELALNFASRAAAAFRRNGLTVSAATASSLVDVLDLSEPLTDSVSLGPVIIAEALAFRGRHAPAEGDRRQALNALSKRPAVGPAEEALGFWAKGQMELADGRSAFCSDSLEAAFNALERAIADLDSAELRAYAVDGIAPLEDLSARLALAADSPEDFRRWIGRARRLVSRSRSGPPEPELAKGLDELRRISAEVKSGEASDHTADLAWQRQQLHRRIQFVSWTAKPQGNEAPAATATGHSDMPDTKETLAPTIVYGQTQTHLVAVGPAAPDRVVELGSAAELQHLIRKFQLTTGQVAQSSRNPGPRQLKAVINTAKKFDELFLAPLVDGSDSPVSIQPSGSLMGIPWRLLPSLAGREVRVYSGYSVSDAPSDRSEQGSVAVCAGPDLQSEEEAYSIAALYPDAVLLTGAQANAGAVRDLMGHVDTIHLLAHGFRNSRDPLMSSLRFLDGDLKLYDFETLPNAPSTVVLASCRVGSAASNHAASYGLGSVLVSRGCSQAVASVAAISESETAIVMKDVHEGLRTGTPAAQVLSNLRYDNPFTQLAGDMLVTLSPLGS